jgi:hypothetical protein
MNSRLDSASPVDLSLIRLEPDLRVGNHPPHSGQTIPLRRPKWSTISSSGWRGRRWEPWGTAMCTDKVRERCVSQHTLLNIQSSPHFACQEKDVAFLGNVAY